VALFYSSISARIETVLSVCRQFVSFFCLILNTERNFFSSHQLWKLKCAFKESSQVLKCIYR